MKHVKLFEGFLNEGTYTDFLMRRAGEIRTALLKLAAIGKVIEKIDEAVGAKIEEKLGVYDTNVSKQIHHWAALTKQSRTAVNADEIARFAVENQNRWGTEPQMVLYAIDDYYDVVSMEIPETPEVDSDDEENEED